MWNGPVEEGESALQALREVAEPIVDLYGEIPYAELQSMIDDPPGKRNWWTAEYLDELPDDALDAIVAYGEQMPISFTQMLLLPWGGEVARRTDSPLAKRNAANFVGDEGEERVRAAFGDAYERLAAVKAEHDPENLFRGNQNIRPRGQLVA